MLLKYSVLLPIIILLDQYQKNLLLIFFRAVNNLRTFHSLNDALSLNDSFPPFTIPSHNLQFNLNVTLSCFLFRFLWLYTKGWCCSKWLKLASKDNKACHHKSICDNLQPHLGPQKSVLELQIVRKKYNDCQMGEVRQLVFDLLCLKLFFNDFNFYTSVLIQNILQ